MLNQSPGTELRLGTMDDVLEIVRRSDRSLVLIGVPSTTILAVNEPCVELFGESATALIGRHAGSLFQGVDEVHASIAFSALAAGAIDSYCARRRVPRRPDVEVWMCVRTLDVEGAYVALAMIVKSDQQRPRDPVEEELATATDAMWLSPASSLGRTSSPRGEGVADTYSVLDRLSPRQRTIVASLLQGDRTAAIATAQFLSESTVRSHLSAIYTAFGVHSQTELLSILRGRNG